MWSGNLGSVLKKHTITLKNLQCRCTKLVDENGLSSYKETLKRLKD